jgi:hypothetical protein
VVPRRERNITIWPFSAERFERLGAAVILQSLKFIWEIYKMKQIYIIDLSQKSDFLLKNYFKK